MMEYKGFVAHVAFDDEAEVFYGEVINLRDVITFEGMTVEELRQAFRDSVDDYLDFCAQRNEAPEKPFSGKFSVRVDPDLHRQLFLRAREANKSLNRWIVETLEAAARAG
ncbi:MAG: type II toxin-antitoxin system HicB family antitoxin [Chloroflexota bacterium]